MQTDYRLQGKAAAVAGAAAPCPIFKAGLDEFLPAEVQVKALAHFEARQEAALDGIAMRTARATIQTILTHVHWLQSARQHWNAWDLQKTGAALVRTADQLKALARQGDPALLPLCAAMRNLGAAFLDGSQAIVDRNVAGTQSAVATIGSRSQEFHVCWKNFNVSV